MSSELSKEILLRNLRNGTVVRWATAAELEGLATELTGERSLTDTLTNWRAVSIAQLGKPRVHILGRRTSRPVITLTSAVLELDLKRGLATTHSGSLYELIEPGAGLATPEVIDALRVLVSGGLDASSLLSSKREWPIARLSAICGDCGGPVVARFGQDAQYCDCRAAMLDITDGRIRGAGPVTGIRIEARVRPLVEAPRDGRPIHVYWRGGEYLACWDEDARRWREVGKRRMWLSEQLLGWTP